MMATIARTVHLRPGTSGDLDGVMTVMDAAFDRRYGEAWTRSQLAGILPMDGVSLTMAHQEGSDAPVGFSLTRTVGEDSELLLLAVPPSHQREGIGGRLLDDFMERAAKSGVRRVHLEVRDGNAAVGMYRAAGFEQAGKRRNYYHAPGGDRFDALTLVKEL